MIAEITLLVLSAWALKSIILFSFQNGLLKFLEQTQRNKSFPNGVPICLSLSGIGWFDQRLKNVLGFIWPFAAGHRPDLSLVGLALVGAFGSAWFLIVMESLRIGNQGTWASHIMIPGVFIFDHSQGLMMPLYFLFHLYVVPERASVEIDSVDALAIMASFVVGYLLPIGAHALPAPTMITVARKQTLIGWYQLWHIYIFVCHLLFVKVIKQFFDPVSTPIWYHRFMYMFAFSLAALPHICVLFLSTLAAIYPKLFAKDAARRMHPHNLFSLTSPWSGKKAPSLDEGLKWLLQWDVLISSLAVLSWSLTLLVRCRMMFDQPVYWGSLVAKIILASVVSSPAGAAVLLMWERDEMVLSVVSD